MEDSTLLDGTWLFSDIMLLTPPPILVSVLDYKKVYLKSAQEAHSMFSMTYYIEVSVLSTRREAHHTSARQGEDVLLLQGIVRETRGKEPSVPQHLTISWQPMGIWGVLVQTQEKEHN
jgi:hypothetical protein